MNYKQLITRKSFDILFVLSVVLILLNINVKAAEAPETPLGENMSMEKYQMESKGVNSRIPILMYHYIDFSRDDETKIPKEKFREQMKYLKENGFCPISLDELYNNLVYGIKLPEKPVVITLDDGYEDNYINAYPILKEFGFKATIFIITGVVDQDKNCLTSNQIKEMDSNGVKSESHTVYHEKLPNLPYARQVEELKKSKEALESILGREVNYLAYPYGSFNSDTINLVKDSGYKMALSTMSGPAEKLNGLYKLHRIYVSNKYDMNYFKKLVNQK